MILLLAMASDLMIIPTVNVFNDSSYFETTFNAANMLETHFGGFGYDCRTDIRVYYEDTGGGFTFDKTGKPKVSENNTGGQGLRLLQVDAIGLGGSLKLSNHAHKSMTGATVELLLPLRNSAGCCHIFLILFSGPALFEFWLLCYTFDMDSTKSSITLGLIGFGNVGQGVHSIVKTNQGMIQDRLGQGVHIKTICVRNVDKYKELANGAAYHRYE